jgi:tetratricopeptide (TPR) repeat protein
LTTVTLAVPALLEPLDGPFQKHPDGMPDRRVTERTFTEIQRFMAESNFASLEEANAAIQARFMGRPMDAMPSTASTPLEKAQDLMYRAFDSRGRRRIQLAKKALEVSRDCADAYVLLAEESPDPETARALYAQGVAAGERALGPKMFEEEAGNFWGPVQTRPYMRARYGLAGCLEDLGREDEAIGHYQELLRLNPNDNQGVRDILLPLLLTVGRNADAGALLAQYANDITATWKYCWALWAFRQEGDSPSARDRLREAVRANPHVPHYLTGRAPIPELLPDGYSLGSPEEAMLCADELIDVWNETPGALAWLLDAAPKKESRKRRRR